MKLYIVPTPIGNLEDVTFRAIRTLREADIILAEDTRKTAILLKKYEINTPMTSNHKFNEHRRTAQLVAQIAQGKSAALVSDAGTPGISDPGFLLVRACVEEGVEVECLPGASALIPALINSGFPCDRFCFEGFLPQKKGRTKRISALASEERTIIFYESPYRTLRCLEQLAEAFGAQRRACVCRELSKIHEENARGTLGELVERFRERDPKGEIVIVVEGCKDAAKTNHQEENEWKNIE